MVCLGDDYYAYVWRPDFAEAWGIGTAFDGDDPDSCGLGA